MAAARTPDRKVPRGIKVIRKTGGTEYHYDRTFTPMRPILAEPYTEAYYKEIAEGRADRTDRTKVAGSLGLLIANYKKTSKWTKELAPRTKSDYEKVFDFLQPLDEMPLADITTAFLLTMRDEAIAGDDDNKPRGRRF